MLPSKINALVHGLITAESLTQYVVVFQSLIYIIVILGLCYSGIPSFQVGLVFCEMYEVFYFHIKLKRMSKLSISSKPFSKDLPFSLFSLFPFVGSFLLVCFFFLTNMNFFSTGISLMTYFISDTEQLSGDEIFYSDLFWIHCNRGRDCLPLQFP